MCDDNDDMLLNDVRSLSFYDGEPRQTLNDCMLN